MSLSLAPILLHSDDVSPAAKRALSAGLTGPVEQRKHSLESAAKLIVIETGVSCAEARELVDLPPGNC
jgi:hypothetical protein